MGRSAIVLAFVLLTACARPHPTYEFETGYLGPGVASPQALKEELRDYASLACGGHDYKMLDQVFVGVAGPSYARYRFACL
jgi:hypothetical protein